MTKSEAIKAVSSLSSGTVASLIGSSKYERIDDAVNQWIEAVANADDSAFKACDSWTEVLLVIKEGRTKPKERKIHLQWVGDVPAIEAKDLKPGMVTVWNGGFTEEVLAVEPSKSGKTLKVKIKSNSSNYVGTRTMKADRLVAVK